MRRSTPVRGSRLTALFLAIVLTQIVSPFPASAQGFRPSRPVQGVYKDRITPHWFDNNMRFWYRNELAGKAKEFILVDAERGTREPAFDHAKLAARRPKPPGPSTKPISCRSTRLSSPAAARPFISPWTRRPGPAIWPLMPAARRPSARSKLPQGKAMTPPASAGADAERADRDESEVHPRTLPTASGRPS